MLADPFSSQAAGHIGQDVLLGHGSEQLRLHVPEWQSLGQLLGPVADLTAPADRGPDRRDRSRIAEAVDQLQVVRTAGTARLDTRTWSALDAALRRKVSDAMLLHEIGAQVEQTATIYALEVCDPVGEDETYVLDDLDDLAAIPLSNFVHPAWFSRHGCGVTGAKQSVSAESVTAGVFDHLRLMGRPFEQHESVGVLDTSRPGTPRWRLQDTRGSRTDAARCSRIERRNRPLARFLARHVGTPDYDGIVMSPPGYR
jgi:hypothetical protein